MKDIMILRLEDEWLNEFMGKFGGFVLAKGDISLRVSPERLIRILLREFEDYQELAKPQEKKE